MAMVRTLLDWVPRVDVKIDPKQATFKFPKELLTLARNILFKRYVDVIGQADDFNVDWTEQYDEGETTPARVDLSLEETLKQELPKSFRQSRIQVFHKTKQRLLITITIYCNGTVMVQGVQCQKWLRNEFDTVIYVVRTIYHLLHRGADGDTVGVAVCDDVKCMAVPSVSFRGKGGVYFNAPATIHRALATTRLMLTHADQTPHTPNTPNSTTSTPASGQQTPLSSRSPTPQEAERTQPSSSASSGRGVRTEKTNNVRVNQHSTPPRSTPRLGKVLRLTANNQSATIISLQQQVASLATLVTDGVGEIRALARTTRTTGSALEQQVVSLTAELANLRTALRDRDTLTPPTPPVSTATASTQTHTDEEVEIQCAIALSNRFALLEQLSDNGEKETQEESKQDPEQEEGESDCRGEREQAGLYARGHKQRLRECGKSVSFSTPSPND
jgi:hypothetical protein